MGPSSIIESESLAVPIQAFPSRANHPHTADRLRVVTYNVHKCRGLDGRVLPHRILRVLEEIDADVIALQEVVCREEKSAERHQARYLAERLGLFCELGENRRHRGGAYGNVLLSRYPILHARNHDISVPGRERRGCLHVELQPENSAVLHIFNLHLGTALYERRMQARQMFGERLFPGAELSGNKIVLGDFNEWTRGLPSRLFNLHFESAHSYMDAHRTRTFPGVLPMLPLDHIYFDRELQLDHVRIHRTPAALMASDHLPVVAEFTLPAESGNAAVSEQGAALLPPSTDRLPEARV
ncbi:MAG TPA: endonuclease/exonuclease/phosphatase family protein [Acidobacteriaceae bacterium]|nr:endonuclease/exonuclease/phosphatase family protein [Acidobacteriaceae bacterium]